MVNKNFERPRHRAVSSAIPSRGHPESICANKYEQHKFAIADLLRQMDLAAPDKQRRRDQATALFTRLAEDRFSAARRSTTFAGRSTRRLSRTLRRYFRSPLGRRWRRNKLTTLDVIAFS